MRLVPGKVGGELNERAARVCELDERVGRRRGQVEVPRPTHEVHRPIRFLTPHRAPFHFAGLANCSSVHGSALPPPAEKLEVAVHLIYCGEQSREPPKRVL
jgi:hypothetical protein